MASELPPPVYSQGDDDFGNAQAIINPDHSLTDSGPQILIIPSADSINFQKGHLGADGERAAIEGELHIKGADPLAWRKLSISLSSNECAYDRSVELGYSEIILYAHSRPNPTLLQSYYLFAIPLTPDTPQSIRTAHSALTHTLTVTLEPLDDSIPPITKSIVVYTKRYSSHVHPFTISPETHSLDDPTHVQVEIPRVTFKVGEPLPIYVTIPPPKRELIVEQGIRLRNIMVELVRTIQVGRQDGSDSDSDTEDETRPTFLAGSPTDDADNHGEGSSSTPLVSSSSGSFYRSVIGRSGASCRFHSTRPIQIRLIVHQSFTSDSPAGLQHQTDLPTTEYGHFESESDADSPAITQTTVLHSITFCLEVKVSFVDMARRVERLSTISIPVKILPPSAPLPEVEQSVGEAYSKKHDRPPARTVRADEADLAPHYDAGAEAGPSGLPTSAPPPFEERDAPPPFFSSFAEPSTSNRLPTFQESEREVILPESDADCENLVGNELVIPGEGQHFGFVSAQQFDGHTEDIRGSSTPPPTLEMASLDPNLTGIADIQEPEHALEVLGLVLEQHEESTRGVDRPPPPPPMDDPSDPPPSIDSEFRPPNPSHSGSPPIPPPPPLHPVFATDTSRPHSPPPPPPLNPSEESHGHAPPPYLGVSQGQEHATRPPPYVD